MKKLTFLAISALLFASCSEENAPRITTEGEAISLSISGPVVLSRTSTAETDGTITTSFVAGDKIGVSATGGATAVNVKHTVSSDGTALTPAQDITFQTDADANLQAYSPYVAEATATGVTFSVKNDQSLTDDFNASNFLTSTATVTKANPKAELSFTPRLTLVYVEMAGALGTNTKKLTLCGMKPTVSWAATTDAVTTEGDATNIIMHKIGETQVYMAFIPAQSSTAAQPLLNIVIGGNKYNYTPTASIEFKANTVKRFKLTVNADQSVNIESSVVQGTNWTADGENTVNIDGEITRSRLELISAEAGNFSGKTLSTATGFQGAKEGWNAIIAGTNNNSSITITENEAVIKTDGGTWFQRGLLFRGPDGEENYTTTKYQLEFDIKGGTDIQVAVMRGQKTGGYTGNSYFAVAGTTAAKVESTTTNYTHKSLEVDLSNNSTGVDFSTGVGVLFFAKEETAGQTHYIKNVTLIEL